jgi:hypothetical protein
MTTTTVSTTRTSQLSMSGTDALNITATGNFTGSSNPQVTVGATTGAGITIDNYGTLSTTNTGGRAIRFTNASTSFHITNEAGATITSQNDAINVQQALTAGTLLVDNYGSIKSTGVNANNGQSIDFGNIIALSGVSVTINNYTGALLDAADADGIRPGNTAADVAASAVPLSHEPALGTGGVDGRQRAFAGAGEGQKGVRFVARAEADAACLLPTLCGGGQIERWRHSDSLQLTHRHGRRPKRPPRLEARSRRGRVHRHRKSPSAPRRPRRPQLRRQRRRLVRLAHLQTEERALHPLRHTHVALRRGGC